MQVSVKEVSELGRKITVSFSEQAVQEKVEERLKSLARKVKINGFRPGKVPLNTVKKMYAQQAQQEVTGDLIESTLFEVLKEQELELAGHPHIHPNHEVAGFEYTAEFEIYPDISLADLPTLEIKKPTASIKPTDIDDIISKLIWQKKTWKTVNRACVAKDQVIINFLATYQGKELTKGKIENYAVELSGRQVPADFEAALIGLKAGDSKQATLSHPEYYGDIEIAQGEQSGEFELELELVRVEQASLPEIDADFIRAHGVEDGKLESLRAMIKLSMEQELSRGLKIMLRDEVLEALHEKIAVTLPRILVDEEIERIVKPLQENAKKQNKELNELDLANDAFEKQAKKTITLHLIMREIMRQNDITIDQDKVRSTLEEMAKNYEKPADFIAKYYANEEQLKPVKGQVLECQIIDWVVKQAKVSDTTIDFKDVVQTRT